VSVHNAKPRWYDLLDAIFERSLEALESLRPLG
jgi:hypothetical protein